MKYLAFFFVSILSSTLADVICYNGDFLSKGQIKEPGTDNTPGCRLYFEMMGDSCMENTIDIRAARAGKGANSTLTCELQSDDNIIQCECGTDNCNTPNFDIKTTITNLVTKTDKDKSIVDCFIGILEKRFGLTTTTITTTIATTTSTTNDTLTTSGKINSTPTSFIYQTILAVVVYFM